GVRQSSAALAASPAAPCAKPHASAKHPQKLVPARRSSARRANEPESQHSSAHPDTIAPETRFVPALRLADLVCSILYSSVTCIAVAKTPHSVLCTLNSALLSGLAAERAKLFHPLPLAGEGWGEGLPSGGQTHCFPFQPPTASYRCKMS